MSSMICQCLSPVTTLALSSTILILAYSSPITEHSCCLLFIPNTPASGPLHKLLLLPEMCFIQISAWSSLLSPLSICSNVFISMRPPTSQSNLILKLPLTPTFLITLFLLFFIFAFFYSTHLHLKYQKMFIVCLSSLEGKLLKNRDLCPFWLLNVSQVLETVPGTQWTFKMHLWNE